MRTPTMPCVSISCTRITCTLFSSWIASTRNWPRSVSSIVRKMFIACDKLSQRRRLSRLKEVRCSCWLKNKTCFVFFGKTFFFKPDDFSLAIEKAKVGVVSVYHAKAIETLRQRLAKNHCDIAARFEKRKAKVIVVFGTGKGQVIVAWHFTSEKSGHAVGAFRVVVELHTWESGENILAVVFDFLPWQVACEVQAEARCHAFFFGRLHRLGNFFPKVGEEGLLVVKEQKSFCDSCALDGRHCPTPCGVETSGGATFACVFAYIKPRKVSGCKVQTVGDKTLLLSLACLGVSCVE